MGLRGLARSAVSLAAAVIVAALPAAAYGADSVYWGTDNSIPQSIQRASLDGTGGGPLSTAGALVNTPKGNAIDTATGKIYWANQSNNKIGSANLDGSGGANFDNTGAATINSPVGIALDPIARRLYVANAANKISFVNLNGTGGGDLPIPGSATLNSPAGLAIDPASDRVYWANFFGNKISFASLSGAGAGGDLSTTGASAPNQPYGVALDVAAGRLYWSNLAGNKISWARLDGSGGGNLNTSGATMNNPHGLAIDPGAGRIYWANFTGNKISYAGLDDSGGADLPTPGADPARSEFPVLLKTPVAAGAPAVSGGSTTGSTLTCSQGSWAADLLGSFLYRAPRSFSYQWTLGGSDIPGATSSSIAANSAGDYGCRVTAQNQSGSSTQTSGPFTVSAPPPLDPGAGTGSGTGAAGGPPISVLPAFGANTLVTLAQGTRRIAKKGPLKVAVTNANGFAITGKLSGQTTKAIAVGKRKKKVSLKAKSFTVAANGKKTVSLVLPRALRTELTKKRKLSIRLTAKVTDPAGNTRTVKKTVSPKL